MENKRAIKGGCVRGVGVASEDFCPRVQHARRVLVRRVETPEDELVLPARLSFPSFDPSQRLCSVSETRGMLSVFQHSALATNPPSEFDTRKSRGSIASRCHEERAR
eukprot:2599931-Rhodomonas_salina.2